MQLCSYAVVRLCGCAVFIDWDNRGLVFSAGDELIMSYAIMCLPA